MPDKSADRCSQNTINQMQPMSYYQYIQGVRYVRDLIDTAKTFTQGEGEGKISYDEVQELYRKSEDGRRITDTERRTLLYIAETFPFTDKAREWLRAPLKFTQT